MTYNLDNLLTGFETTNGPMFTLNEVTVDGLGRLTDANETITKTDSSTVAHSLTYDYDMLSQLTDANISNIAGGNWLAQYIYKKNGDMISRTIQSNTETFAYDGHLMTEADGNSLDWDENGQLIYSSHGPQATSYEFNWDNKLREANTPDESIALRYDPAGNRIWKDSSVSGTRKYIVDIVGDLPVILLEIDTSDDSIAKSYMYANSQIIAQHDGDYATSRYFYLHDRLGSVRQLIDTNANVVIMYTYEPFGDTLEVEGTLSNLFMFTGQYFDSEIDEYYLRTRQYYPYISRFTSRDQVFGKFEEPLSLHKYLYCQNEPINRIDPLGLVFLLAGAGNHYNLQETQTIVDLATEVVGQGWFSGPMIAFALPDNGGLAMFDYKQSHSLKFTLPGYGNNIKGSEFSNYLAAYTTYYNYGYLGLYGAVVGGQGSSVVEGWFDGDLWRNDDMESILWMTRGGLDANLKLKSKRGRGLSGQIDEILLMNAKRQAGIAGFLNDLDYQNEINTNWFD